MNADNLAQALRDLCKRWDDLAGENENEAARLAHLPVANELARDGSQYRQSASQVRNILAEHDAQAAQARNSLLIGTTPDGRPYGLHGTKESVEAVSDLIEAQAAQPVGVPDGWTDRHSKVQKYALQRFMWEAHHRANLAGQDKEGRFFKSGAVGAFLADAKVAEECLAMLAAAPQPPAQPSADAEDAARYRWLRANAVSGRMESRGPRPDFAINCDEPESEWDAAIDAARAAEGGES